MLYRVIIVCCSVLKINTLGWVAFCFVFFLPLHCAVCEQQWSWHCRGRFDGDPHDWLDRKREFLYYIEYRGQFLFSQNSCGLWLHICQLFDANHTQSQVFNFLQLLKNSTKVCCLVAICDPSCFELLTTALTDPNWTRMCCMLPNHHSFLNPSSFSKFQ